MDTAFQVVRHLDAQKSGAFLHQLETELAAVASLLDLEPSRKAFRTGSSLLAQPRRRCWRVIVRPRACAQRPHRQLRANGPDT